MKNFEHIKLAKLSLAGIPKPESQLTYRGVPLHEFTAEEVAKIVAKIKALGYQEWTIPDPLASTTKSKPAFRVGDRVYINSQYKNSSGSVGTIKVVLYYRPHTMYDIEIDGLDGERWCRKGSALQHHTDEPKHVCPDFPYKPWDRVQLVQADVEGYTTRCNSVNKHAGELATVVRYNGGKWYTVEPDSSGKGLTVHLDHLASTTKLKPAFGVGDRVIVSGFSTILNEAFGTVKDIQHHTDKPLYSVKLDIMGGTWEFEGRYLEPAPQTDNSFIRSEN